MPTPPAIFVLNGPNLNLLGNARAGHLRRPAGIPIIEVHLSNVYAREHLPRQSYIAQVARGSIVGLGPMGYVLALDAAAQLCKGAAKSAARIQ